MLILRIFSKFYCGVEHALQKFDSTSFILKKSF